MKRNTGQRPALAEGSQILIIQRTGIKNPSGNAWLTAFIEYIQKDKRIE
jgi:hypothetical protein